MSFNKQNLKTIRADINAALKAVETKHNMKLSIGNIRFHAEEFRTTLTAATGEAATKEAPSSETKWRAAFMRNLFIGVSQTDLDKEITLRGKKYTIVGARPKAQAPLVLKEVLTGKYIAASELEVRDALFHQPRTLADHLQGRAI